MNALHLDTPIPSAEASVRSGYGIDTLAKLCQEGKIAGFRSGSGWVISGDSLDAFLASQASDAHSRMRMRVGERGGYAGVMPSFGFHDAMTAGAVLEALSRMPVMGERAIVTAFTLFVLAGSVFFAGNGTVARVSTLMLDGAFSVRASVLAGADQFLAHAAQERQAIASSYREPFEARDRMVRSVSDAPTKHATDSVVTMMATAHEPVRALALADERARSISAQMPATRSFEEIATSVRSAVSNPGATMDAVGLSLIKGYRSLGEGVHTDVQIASLAYAGAIESSGEAVLASGTFVRDTVVRAPATLARAQLALGTGVIDAVNATGTRYVEGVTLWATVTPEVPSRVLGTLYSIGDTIANAVGTSIQAAPQRYEAATYAWVEGSEALAIRIVETEITFGTRATDAVAYVLAEQEQTGLAAVEGVRGIASDITNGVPRTRVLASAALAQEPEVPVEPSFLGGVGAVVSEVFSSLAELLDAGMGNHRSMLIEDSNIVSEGASRVREQNGIALRLVVADETRATASLILSRSISAISATPSIAGAYVLEVSEESVSSANIASGRDDKRAEKASRAFRVRGSHDSGIVPSTGVEALPQEVSVFERSSYRGLDMSASVAAEHAAPAFFVLRSVEDRVQDAPHLELLTIETRSSEVGEPKPDFVLAVPSLTATQITWFAPAGRTLVALEGGQVVPEPGTTDAENSSGIVIVLHTQPLQRALPSMPVRSFSRHIQDAHAGLPEHVPYPLDPVPRMVLISDRRMGFESG